MANQIDTSISELRTIKQNLAAALTDMGVDTTTNEPLTVYASRIRHTSGGGSSAIVGDYDWFDGTLPNGWVAWDEEFHDREDFPDLYDAVFNNAVTEDSYENRYKWIKNANDQIKMPRLTKKVQVVNSDDVVLAYYTGV